MDLQYYQIGRVSSCKPLSIKTFDYFKFLRLFRLDFFISFSSNSTSKMFERLQGVAGCLRYQGTRKSVKSQGNAFCLKISRKIQEIWLNFETIKKISWELFVFVSSINRFLLCWKTRVTTTEGKDVTYLWALTT